MSAVQKNKLLTWLVLLLLVANAATIAFFWFNRNQKPPLPMKGGPKEFLIKELKLDSNQKIQLDVLVKAHRDSADILRKKVREAKENMFDLLKQNVSDSAKQNAARAVSLLTEQLDLLTFDHFQKIRALCNPQQQQKFDGIIQDITRMIGQPQPPMRPGGPDGPHGPHDGPPPGEMPPPQ